MGRYLCVLTAASLPLAVSLGIIGNQPAVGKSQAREMLHYLNPLPEKGTYLNESQDRLIKKKAFKIDQLPDVAAVQNKEVGIFALVSDKQLADTAFVEKLLAHPQVNGLSVMFTWAELEPKSEEFNWAPVDQVLEAAAKYNKNVILRVSTAGVDKAGNNDTPDWVFAGNIKALPYTGADGKPHKMPIFWDSTYLAEWNNFIKEMGGRYDKHPNIHSIGITGGGIGGGTTVIPVFAQAGVAPDKSVAGATEQKLKAEFGMSPRQLVEHWKYVADLFPQAFPSARLNFDIDPPTPNRAGQDALDEISDYLVYRYGGRVFLTRQNIANDKHGFDQYRVLLKFHPDTYTGYQLTSTVTPPMMANLAKFALDDGISFAEVPADLITSTDTGVQAALKHMTSHMGYQVLSQKAVLPAEVESGKPLKASFTFMNVGSATPMRPLRAFDKDAPSSYKVQIELRDPSGKPVVISLHTPETGTHQWAAGKPISWEEELKMPKLQPGEYKVFMSIVDADTKRKLNFLDGITQKEPAPSNAVALGSIKVTNETRSVGSTNSETK
jgi:hypothetical protein